MENRLWSEGRASDPVDRRGLRRGCGSQHSHGRAPPSGAAPPKRSTAGSDPSPGSRPHWSSPPTTASRTHSGTLSRAPARAPALNLGLSRRRGRRAPGFSALLTGDADEEIKARLLAGKLGHHGSIALTSEAFLQATSPSISSSPSERGPPRPRRPRAASAIGRRHTQSGHARHGCSPRAAGWERDGEEGAGVMSPMRVDTDVHGFHRKAPPASP